MIWKSKLYLKDRLGEERIVKRFLWLPFEDGGQWRWLNKVWVKEKICKVDVGGSVEWGNYAYKWCKVGIVKTPPKNEITKILLGPE